MFFIPNKISNFADRKKGVLCNFGTNLKRKILKYNIIIKN